MAKTKCKSCGRFLPKNGRCGSCVPFSKPKKGKTKVYFARCTLTGRIKIGASSAPTRRIAHINTCSPAPVYLIGSIPGGFSKEKELHHRFAYCCVHNEWFDPSPRLIDFIVETFDLKD